MAEIVQEEEATLFSELCKKLQLNPLGGKELLNWGGLYRQVFIPNT